MTFAVAFERQVRSETDRMTLSRHKTDNPRYGLPPSGTHAPDLYKSGPLEGFLANDLITSIKRISAPNRIRGVFCLSQTELTIIGSSTRPVFRNNKSNTVSISARIWGH